MSPAVDYYESAAAVEFLTRCFCPLKEQAYCRYVLGLVPASGSVLELGGGSGFQGAIFAEHLGARYTFSDRSAAMIASAGARGLKAEYRDALSPGAIEQDIVLALQLSTICATNPGLRRAQFQALGKAMKPGAILLIATARPGNLHTIDRNDLAWLAASGFRLLRWTSWGLVPTSLWKFDALGLAERLFSLLDIGIRRIAVLQRDRVARWDLP